MAQVKTSIEMGQKRILLLQTVSSYRESRHIEQFLLLQPQVHRQTKKLKHVGSAQIADSTDSTPGDTVPAHLLTRNFSNTGGSLSILYIMRTRSRDSSLLLT
jgi:hypothetical protein